MDRISNSSVKALECPTDKSRRVFLWDSRLAGFGVCGYPNGRKVYVAQYRLHGCSHRMKLGEHGRITPDEARSEAKKVLGAVEKGIDPVAERQKLRGLRTFKEASEDFMRLRAATDCKPRTVEGYKILLARHILPVLGSRPLLHVTTADAMKLRAKMSDTPTTANRALELISAIWNWAAVQKEVPKDQNPAEITRYPEKKRERYLSTAEFARLGDTLKLAETEGLPWDIKAKDSKHVPKTVSTTKIDEHAVAAIRLLIFTGARLREILDAQWEWVDWDRSMLHLPDSKTGAKTIYLPGAAIAILQRLSRNGSYIIPGEDPKKHRADLKKPWAAIQRAAKLDGVRLHDLRHTFAATGAGQSLGLPMIGKLLGHTQAQTTARYAHLDADPMHKAVNAIGDKISAAMDGKNQTLKPN